MTITALYENTATIGTTEYSLVSNSTTLATDTTDGVFQAWIDLSALTVTEQYELAVYEKVTAGGTKRAVYVAALLGPVVPAHLAIPSLILMHGWDVTLKKIAGTDRSIGWSIRQVA